LILTETTTETGGTPWDIWGMYEN